MTPEQRADSLIASDSWLEPYRGPIEERHRVLDTRRAEIGDPLGEISEGHRYFGFNIEGEELIYREWAPGATYVALIGDFNGWDRGAHPLVRDDFGVWSVRLPMGTVPHGSPVKVHVAHPEGGMDRIPAYIRRVEQVTGGVEFQGIHWMPAESFEWQHPRPARPTTLRIYEAHVGMATEDGHVGSFREFATDRLPKIAALGYNAVQLMAVMEHPYYGSFGYHVSNFFAVSSRFGTPEDLKFLVDEAHRLGLRVIMDIVHSHAVKNVNEGLAWFDGTDHQYFHAGLRGQHTAWDSMCFDYAKYEVLRFLLSNVRFWLDEFRMDGFRFDGVTSMMFLDHGLGRAFTGYDDYFGANVDEDAVAYLALANEVAHAAHPDAITIAEDVSGLAGLAIPLHQGGVGFDYRLAMAVPDLWIKLLKEFKDEDWPLGHILYELTNRRAGEKAIAYAESHDQALVGDKTLAFWLMDAAMYQGMSKFVHLPVIDRGIALHKMIRLLTFAAGGEGYLNFMGNEFGHPEWIDFPREGNGFSHHYARRQWHLAEQDHLRYAGLQAFDAAMQRLDIDHEVLSSEPTEELVHHEDTRQLVFRRGGLVFAFNFHPTESFEGLRIPVPARTDYRLILTTDAEIFGGFDRVSAGEQFPWQDVPMYAQNQSLQIYLPARSALVFAPLALP